MPDKKNHFVQVCQQAFAFALVGAVAASAAGVVELEIIAPEQNSTRPFVPDHASLVSEGPVKPRVRTVPMDQWSSNGLSSLPSKSRTAEPAPQGNRVLSRPEQASGYATVGVTWESGQELSEEEIAVSVRTRAEGVWSPWQEMHYDPDHEPEPGTEEGLEARVVRAGTDAVVVGDVEDVQVRAVTSTGTTPRGLALAIVDPGVSLEGSEQEPAIDAGALSSAVRGASLTAGETTAPKPRIFSRAQWGADERLRDKGSLRYGEINAGFVHHTVNANNYDRAHVPSILRGIYAYHTQSRGWSDVGYNFLVDRFGRIWEGRYGGVDRPVVGAHTLHYNEESFAMSAIGNFETVRPSQAMINAYGALMAWKLSLHGIDADDTRQVVAGRAMEAINGHRDAGSTACPGRFLYAQLDEIRRLAAQLQRSGAEPDPPTEPRPPSKPSAPAAERVLRGDLSGGPWPDLIVRDERTARALIVRTGGQVAFLDPETAATGWRGMDLVTAPGDLDGDGRADLIARSSATKKTSLYPGTGRGTLSAPTRTFARFSRLDQLTGVGDLNRDGHNDLVGRDAATDSLRLYPGNGSGGFTTARELSADWSPYDLTAGVNDFNGDGRMDLVARAGATLYLVPGTARGLGRRVPLAGRWDAFDVIAGRGDASGDRVPDLVARVRSTGMTYVYPGNGTGQWTPRIGGWTRFRHLRGLTLAGNLVDTRKPDLAGVNARTGALRVFPNSGRRNLGRTIDTGAVLAHIDLLLNVGDWNGDGRGDVMTRDDSSGTLHFRAGLDNNRLAAPVAVGTGWDQLSLVAPVGDVTGDGRPDLVARGPAGRDRIFPSDGDSGFGPTEVVELPRRATGRLGLSLWDGDATPDIAARRRDGSLWLWASDAGENRRVAEGLRSYDWVRGLGDLDGDGRADVVARARRTGMLWLLPGSSDGLGPRRLIGTGFGVYDLTG